MSIAMPADRRPAFASPSPTGRLRQAGVSDGDRNLCVALHLSPLLGFLVVGPLAPIIPLVLWLVRKDESGFVDDHGRELLNFTISFVLLHVIIGLTFVGIVFFPVLWVVGIVNVVRGAVASSNGEYFRYPMTFRFLK